MSKYLLAVQFHGSDGTDRDGSIEVVTDNPETAAITLNLEQTHGPFNVPTGDESHSFSIGATNPDGSDRPLKIRVRPNTKQGPDDYTVSILSSPLYGEYGTFRINP